MVNRYLLMIKLNFDFEARDPGLKKVLKKLKAMSPYIYASVLEIEKSTTMLVEK